VRTRRDRGASPPPPSPDRYRVGWHELLATEIFDDLSPYAAALAAGYNDPRNALLMGHTAPIEPVEVLQLYADAARDGARSFLLFEAGGLVGDADLRNLRDGAAEFAFMIASPASQGKGLGTRFAIMVHTVGFQMIQLAQIYASVMPTNTASRRVFEKLGYVVDDSPAARAFADEPEDVVLSIDRATFDRINGPATLEMSFGGVVTPG